MLPNALFVISPFTRNSSTDFASDVEFVTSALTICFTAALRFSRISSSTFWNSFLPGSFVAAIDANSELFFFIYTVYIIIILQPVCNCDCNYIFFVAFVCKIVIIRYLSKSLDNLIPKIMRQASGVLWQWRPFHSEKSVQKDTPSIHCS